MDTRASRYLSLFVHDKNAVNYLNDKKKNLLNNVDALGWKFDGYRSYTQKIKEVVSQIEDVELNTLTDSLQWEQMLKGAIKGELEELEKEEAEFQQEITALYYIIEGKQENKNADEENKLSKENVYKKIFETEQKIKEMNTLINLASNLNLSEKESKLLCGEVLLVEGKAGAGKSHMFTNETVELLEDNRYALLLIGGDYYDNNTIQEQIMKNLHKDYSSEELLDILEGWGAENNCIVPILIDALNETWNISLWKSGLPAILGKIKEMKYIRLVISFRSEYRKLLIDDTSVSRYDICEIKHNGFEENTMEAAQKFLNHYGISFTPLHFFSANITNPLFLTLYCKTYQGDEVELPVLYERILECANNNIHKSLVDTIRTLGYDSTEDLVTPVVYSIAEFVFETGKKVFSLREITELPVWRSYGLNARPFIQQLTRENILHDYVYDGEKKLYFSYDQMNDFYCAKVILYQCKTKECIRDYLKKNVLGINNGKIVNYGNYDLFINVCALYALQYGEECIDIIDAVEDEYDRGMLFENYVDSLQWRKCNVMTLNQLLELFKKYSPQTENVWEMFITNSVKLTNSLNAEALHKMLMEYPLNKRDFLWTTYINQLDEKSDHRLVQLVSMYNQGNYLEGADENQLELLLILFGWCLTSSNRWIRDITSKAMIEILKLHFSLSKKVLAKFERVNDPYVIQRLYGVVFGACVRRKQDEKNIYHELVNYVYKSIFNKDMVYADILLRDYARLIIERFLYEYPEEKTNYEYEKIIPPYASEKIPEMVDQGYLENDYSSGSSAIIRSMKFEGMGMYGDFGRYVFQAALADFNVEQSEIFNYAINYIFNELGYNEELLGKYDKSLGRYYYRHEKAKIERIGKKYQWIAMYNILARVADHYDKIERYSFEKTKEVFEGAWNPYVRDFDPTINSNFMQCPESPIFESIHEHMKTAKIENTKTMSEDKWLDMRSDFFENQKTDLILNGSDGQKWIVLSKYADVGRDNLAVNGKKSWNWIFGYFITEEQRKVLQKYSDKKVNLLDGNITWIPETYVLFGREFPWSPSCKSLIEYSWKEIEVKTGEKKTITETYETPYFLNLESVLSQDDVADFEEDEVAEIVISMKTQTITKEVDITEKIGKILSASVELRWEEEYDISKENTISISTPCAEIIETLQLSQQVYDGYLYDKNGNLAAFDTALTNQNTGIVIRIDLLDEFLRIKNMKLAWFVKGAKEIHLSDLSIEKYTDWTGFLTYDGEHVNGEIFKTKYD